MATVTPITDVGIQPPKTSEEPPPDGKPFRPPPPPSPEELAAKMKEMVVSKDGDLVIWAFNRSGTHWLHDILWMLIHETLEPAPRKENFFIDFVKPEDFAKIDASPRILNTHFPYPVNVANVFKDIKLLYILREPRDAIVSMYNAFHSSRKSWQEFWDELYGNMVTNCDVAMGKTVGDKKHRPEDWFENYFGFKEYESNAQLMAERSVPFLKLKYETMKANLHGEIRRTAAFLGVERSETFIDSIVGKTSIDNMRKAHADDYTDKEFEHEKDMLQKHYRKGQIGDWKNWFTVAQNEQFEQLYRRRMGDVKYEDL